MSNEPDTAVEYAPLKVWVAYPKDWSSPRESQFEVAYGEDLTGGDFAYLAKCYPTEKLALVAIGTAGPCMFLKCTVSEAQPVRRAGVLLIRIQCEMIERLDGETIGYYRSELRPRKLSSFALAIRQHGFSDCFRGSHFAVVQSV